MKAAVVLPEPAWPAERLLALCTQLRGILPFLNDVDAAAHGEAPIPAVAFFSGRRIGLKTLEQPGYDLVLFLENPAGRFNLKLGSNDRVEAYFPGRIPTAAEVEEEAFRILYSGQASAKHIATLLLEHAVPKTPVVVAFSGFRGGPLERRVILDQVEARFGHRGVIVIAVDPAQQQEYGAAYPDAAVETVDAALRRNAQLWILVANRGESQVVRRPNGLPAACSLHIAGPEGYLVPLRSDASGTVPSIEPAENSHVAEHVFARLCQRTLVGGWYVFPYGFGQLHANGVGPMNSFGLRIAHDLKQLARRGPEHKVVAMFGGSSVHALEVPHKATTCSVLEMLLNEEAKRRDKPWRVSVLNFGLSGFMQLNQIMAYVLFCHELRPDIVIAHDGFNDLTLGMVNDPALMSRYQVGYSPNFEQWGQILQGTAHEPLTQTFSADAAIRILNSPHVVVDAYIARKRQFAEMITARGNLFVSGLQPVAFGKRLSPRELTALQTFFVKSMAYKDVYTNLPHLYRMVQGRKVVGPECVSVDVHARFAGQDVEMDSFSDIVHLTSAGNRAVAEAYFEALHGHAIFA